MQQPSLEQPGLTATFTLKLSDLEGPDRVVLTAFPERDVAFGWDLPVKNMGNDAVVGLFWSPQEIKPGGTRTVGYAYGGGAV